MNCDVVVCVLGVVVGIGWGGVKVGIGIGQYVVVLQYQVGVWR